MSLHHNDRFTQIEGPCSPLGFDRYEVNRHAVREHEEYIDRRAAEGAAVQVGMHRKGWPTGGQTVRRIEGETGWTPRFQDHLAPNLPDTSISR